MAALLLGSVAGACSDDGGSSDRAPTVASSAYPLSELTRGVAGSHVRVLELTPAGAEPHDVELTSRQVDRARTADVLLYLGGGFQPAVEDLAGQVEGETADLLDGLPVLEDDAHVWLDPVLLARMAERVADVLAEVDPDGAGDYAAGADRYAARLRTLDRTYRDALAECDRNVVITSHASFEYLTSRYGLEQEAIAVSPEAEPDPRRLAELTELITAGGVTTVFTEPLVDDGAATALARETGIGTAELDPLETGAATADGSGYFSAMERNLQVLQAGLGCR